MYLDVIFRSPSLLLICLTEKRLALMWPIEKAPFRLTVKSDTVGATVEANQAAARGWIIYVLFFLIKINLCSSFVHNYPLIGSNLSMLWSNVDKTVRITEQWSFNHSALIFLLLTVTKF
jgi:hypothetical protein